MTEILVAMGVVMAILLTLMLVNVLLFMALKSGIPQRTLVNPSAEQADADRLRE